VNHAFIVEAKVGNVGGAWLYFVLVPGRRGYADVLIYGVEHIKHLSGGNVVHFGCPKPAITIVETVRKINSK
jgi:hypothetical protein